jgi:hypothetical protein
MNKILKISALVAGALFIIINPAFAAQFSSDKEYILNENEIVGSNLYSVGNNIIINGKVMGDLIGAGSNILVSGEVTKSLMVAGNTVTVLGNVGDSLRAAGGNIVVSGNINKDFLVAGGTINITKDAKLNGDIRIAGRRITINGNINGQAKIIGEEVIINGKISNDIEITANKSLTIESNAVLGANVKYKTPQEANIIPGANVGDKLSFEKIEGYQKPTFNTKAIFTAITVFWFIKLLALITAGLSIYFLFKKFLQNLVSNVISSFGKELAIGFVSIVTLPALIVILLVSIAGFLFGILGIAFMSVVCVLATIISGIVFGSLLFKWLLNEKKLRVDWISIVVGIVALNILARIPFVGWILSGVIYLASFGILLDMIYQQFWIKKM